jgi:hypothetical protein
MTPFNPLEGANLMGIDVSLTLQDLNCIQQDRGSDGSYPFIWPTMVAINTSTATVIVVGSEAPSLARVILANGMKSGDSASIPSTVGVITRRFDEDLSNFKIIAIVALLEKRDLSDDEILGGFTVFPGALQDGIEANLAGLASTDPTIFQNAINAITDSVHQQVLNAVKARMSGPEQLEYGAGEFVADSVIDTAHAEISTTSDSTFQLTFGNTPGNESNNYTMDAAAQFKTVTCEAELDAVNQDTVVVNQLDAQLAQMKKELAQAPASEKKEIEQDILEFTKTELNPAKSKLAKDTQALNACRAGSVAAA